MDVRPAITELNLGDTHKVGTVLGRKPRQSPWFACGTGSDCYVFEGDAAGHESFAMEN